MAVALIWAVAAIVLGIFTIKRVDAFVRDKQGLPNFSKVRVAVAERLTELEVKKAVHNEEVELRKARLARETAVEQALTRRAHDLSDEQVELERTRLKAKAENEAARARQALELERVNHLVDAYTTYINSCTGNHVTRLGFDDFVRSFELLE